MTKNPETLAEAMKTALSQPGRQATINRKWITKQMRDEREHEMSMALLTAFAKDPELKYFIGMASGLGVAWIGAIIGQQAKATGDTGGTSDDFLGAAYNYMGGPILEKTVPAAAMTKIFAGFGGNSEGLTGNIGNILALGGTGFTGICTMILILRSIFSGTDLGELLSGMGEILPL